MDAETRRELKRLVSEEQKRRYNRWVRLERAWAARDAHQKRLALALAVLPDDSDSATIKT